MDSNIPNVPSGLPFRNWGLVPSVCLVSGLPVLLLGASGEIFFANRKLMLGWLLLLCGAMWHYARRTQMRRSLVEGMKLVLFVTFTTMASYCVIYARLPDQLGVF